VRGISHQVEVWKTLAQSHFWRWKRLNLETGEDEEILVQGALRPSLFGSYEYIFPEECLSEVLAVFGITKEDYIFKSFSRKISRVAIRKALGCKPIPLKNFKEAEKMPESLLISNSMRGLSHNKIPGVAIHAIGIKTDKRDKLFNFYQEYL
jgi:hypothetical protein